MTSPITHLPQPIQGAFNANSLEALSKAKDRDHIGGLLNRVFDQIKDWFYNTHVYEAKQYLYDILSADSSDQQRLMSFEKLRDLAGAGFEDRFSANRISPDAFSLEIALDEPQVLAHINLEALVLKDLEPTLNPEKVLSLLREDAAKSLTNQFEKDITREHGKMLMVNDQEVPKSISKLNDKTEATYTAEGFKLLAEKNQFNENEIETALKVGDQRAWGILSVHGARDFHANMSRGFGTSSKESIQLSRNADGNAVLVMTYEFNSYNDCNDMKALVERGNFMKEREIPPDGSGSAALKYFGAGSLYLEVIISANGEIAAANPKMKLSEYVGP